MERGTFHRYKILNQRGSTIIMAMVLTVVTFITGLYLLQNAYQAKMQSETVFVTGEFDGLVQLLYNSLQAESSCRRMFGGPLAYGVGAPVAGQGFGADATPGAHVNASIPVTLYYPNDPFTGTVMVGGGADYGRLHDVTITLTLTASIPPNLPATDSHIYFATLGLSAKKSEDGVGANLGSRGTIGSNEMVNNNIRMTVRLDNNNDEIVSCTALTFANNANNPTNMPICKTDEALKGDATGHLKCLRVNCPVGSTITGYDGSGNVTCS